MSVHEKMTAIADSIREKTGKTEKLDLDDIASGVDEVYADGKKAEYDAFWDAFQDNGNRTNYENGFNGFGFSPANFYPKYDIAPINATNMFINWNEDYHEMNLKERMQECGVTFDFSKATNITRLFYYNSEFTEFPEINLSMATLLDKTFAYNYKMVSIEKLTVGIGTVFIDTFLESRNIKKLIIDGIIGQNGFDVHLASQLTHESLISIINALADYSGTGTTKTVTLGSDNLNKLTDAEKAIATNKGWTLA